MAETGQVGQDQAICSLHKELKEVGMEGLKAGD